MIKSQLSHFLLQQPHFFPTLSQFMGWVGPIQPSTCYKDGYTSLAWSSPPGHSDWFQDE